MIRNPIYSRTSLRRSSCAAIPIASGRLEKIVAEARAAETLPWDLSTLRLYQTIVPQMTLWLPAEEAAQWRLAFGDQVERLNGS